MVKEKNKEAIKILEDNKLTNIYPPYQQLKLNLEKAKTLEEEKAELESSMKSSRQQEYVRKEMDKIRAEGWKEESTTDTHKIIKEAERRVKANEHNG